MWLADLRQAGATNVSIPLVENRDHASDQKIVEQVRNASGIFIGGGDQVKLVSALSGTPLEEAIRDAFIDGAIICGTSAGAAALGVMFGSGPGHADGAVKERRLTAKRAVVNLTGDGYPDTPVWARVGRKHTRRLPGKGTCSQ